MKRLAILGGGISGLAAAYELELARKRGAELDWHLYEASDRLGGIVQTTRLAAPEGEYLLEGGPDAWVSEKPWARELAVELGLGAELIESNDATRKTYIALDGKLQAIPDGMRMMAPNGLDALHALQSSPLFSPEAIAAYKAEPARAEELKASAPQQDESVASFVRRHFGEEVLEKIGGPLLSGVFGGDVHKLSVRAVMAPFVKMEQEHGSLILALEAKHRSGPAKAIFTSLRRGVGSLAEALVATLPAERLHLSQPALSLKRQGNRWLLRTAAFATEGRTAKKHLHHVFVAASVDAARTLLQPLDGEAAALLPTEASSAVLAAFTWPAPVAASFALPPGFGFLVPQQAARVGDKPGPQLLAGTFVDQKFPHRAPPGARIVRAFFGSGSAEHFAETPDAEVAAAALRQLQELLGPMPDPAHTVVNRWPRSLPQYEVGHLSRMAELDRRVAELGGLTLLGNSYRGVGLPDLIRDARAAVRDLLK